MNKKLDIFQVQAEIQNVVTKIRLEHDIPSETVIFEDGTTLDGQISRKIFEIYHLLKARKDILDEIEVEEFLSLTPDDEDFEIMPSDIYCLDPTPTADQRTQMLEESEYQPEYNVENEITLSEEEREYIIDTFHEEPEDLPHHEVVEAILERRNAE